MKSLKKFLTIIFILLVLLFCNNDVYATTAVPEEGIGMGKILLIFIGVILVALVLYIGYKMDKSETLESISSEKRKPKKEKAVRVKEEKENITKVREKKVKTKSEGTKVSSKSKVREDSYRSFNEDDIPYEIEMNESYEHEFVNMDDINEDLEYIEEDSKEDVKETKKVSDFNSSANLSDATMAFNIDELNELLVKNESEGLELNNSEKLDDQIYNLQSSNVTTKEENTDENDDFLKELKKFEVPEPDVEDFSAPSANKKKETSSKRKDSKLDNNEKGLMDETFLEQMENNLLKNKQKRLKVEDNHLDEKKSDTANSKGSKTKDSKPKTGRKSSKKE